MNGLGLTKAHEEEHTGGNPQVLQFAKRGLVNDKADNPAPGLRIDTALINGISLARETTDEPPRRGIGRRSRRKWAVYERVRKKSMIAVDEMVKGKSEHLSDPGPIQVSEDDDFQ